MTSFPPETPLRHRARARSCAAAVVLALAFTPAFAQGTQATTSPATSAASSNLSATVKELQKTDIKQGTGAEALSGKPVLVHYTGWLYDSAAPEGKGSKFDSSRDRGVPFGFFLGSGKVIKGWDEGVVGMKKGGKRKLTIPSDLAYGKEGKPPTIPGDAPLVFEIELLSIGDADSEESDEKEEELEPPMFEE